jgi:DNA repair exonuclease SbcCD nuclease subunit
MLVADIHVDDILSTVHLKELKKQIEKQQPDFVLIAGDFFNRANLRQAEYYETLQGIDIPMYAIQGNHDTMGNLQALNRIAELTNMQFLYNESLMLPDINMQIIGIEEHGQRKNATINEILTKSNIQS